MAVPSTLFGDASPAPRRMGLLRAIAGSVLVHILLAPAAPHILQPGHRRHVNEDPLINLRTSTPLVAPRSILTQKEPTKGPVSQEIKLANLLSKESRPAPPTSRSVFQPPKPTPAPAASAAAAPLPAPPAGLTAVPPPQQGPELGLGQGLPQTKLPPPPEKPKIAFESVGAQQVAQLPQGVRIPPAGQNTTQDAIRAMQRGQVPGPSLGGDISEARSRAGGQPAPKLELMSDTEGVDFKAYLAQVLSAVRRNWLSVIPESARYGQRGKVVVQFAIRRDGRVVKVVYADPSGLLALDRAAVAGISASDPFPPLPPEFKGEQIRLQMAFSYNLP